MNTAEQGQVLEPNNLKLPFVAPDAPIWGARQLQKASSSDLERLKETGPTVICVNSDRKAILVDFEQFMLFQKRFNQLMNLNTDIFRLKIPDGYHLKDLKLKIQATIKKIVNETSESSPLADYMDTIVGLGAALFSESSPAPPQIKARTKEIRIQGKKKVKVKSGRSRKTYSK